MNEKVKEIKELQDHANKLGEIITQQTNKRIQLEDRIKQLEKECEFRKVAVDRWVPCPDHRDKTDGQCYVCKLEKAEERIKELEEENHILEKEIARLQEVFQVLNEALYKSETRTISKEGDEELYKLIEKK